MKTTAEVEGRRYLNAWAREQGYSDYDTYLAIGGKVSDTAASLSREMKRIGYALGVLYGAGEPEPFEPPLEEHRPVVTCGDCGRPWHGETECLPKVAEEDLDAPDASNAHAQGA